MYEMTTTEPKERQMIQPLNAGTTQAVALAAAVLDKRIATAKQWPRSISTFKNEAKTLLHEDVETARSAEYSKPVGGGKVTGPSVRLAEIAALCWRNIEVEISDPVITENSVTVQAFAWDMERNIRMPGMATTSILTKEGKRYVQHMVETATIATAAKARRNAILSVIPRAYINDLLEIAKEVAKANRPPLEKVRQDMLAYFERTHRVTAEQVFAYLDIKGTDEVSYEHLDELRTVMEAIKEGESPEVYFGKAKSKAELAKEKVQKRAEQKKLDVEA
jgi:hypothetical protein